MADRADFLTHFALLPDPRVERSKRHLLIDILFIAVCTVICGGEGFTDMHAFGEAKALWPRKFLELRYGIPSHDTSRRVFSRNDPEAFGECFPGWTVNLLKNAKLPKASVRSGIKKAGWDNSFLEAILVG